MQARKLQDKIILATTTLLGVGYTPLCPGTAASLVAVLVFILIPNPVYFLSFTLISVVVSYLLSGKAEKIFKEKDCKKIVIDDFSGMLITFLFIPYNIKYIVCGFFLFRMLDMLKVPPADRIEKFGGSKGIVGDDVVAGIYANLILQVVRLLVNIFS
jgi:phosphatidylglycerophosphatase A